MERPGWSLSSHVSECIAGKRFVATTPSAPNKELRGIFIYGAAGVVAFELCFGTHSWKTVCGRPPRLRRIRSFAAILLVAQPPSSRGGDYARPKRSTNFFTAPQRIRDESISLRLCGENLCSDFVGR